MKPLKSAAILALLFAWVCLLALSDGCAPKAISVPPDAPLQISTPTTTVDPYVRQHGQWVQTKGNVTIAPGRVVVTLPATVPSK